MKNFITNCLKDWGFNSHSDFMTSVFHYKQTKMMIAFSLPISMISTFIDKYLGLELMVYVSFLILLAVEFGTGVLASIREGKKIESRRFGRFIVKVMVYTSMIGVSNIMGKAVVSNKFNYMYELIHWVIIHLITIQLIISVFENMSRLGFQESSRVFKKINGYLSKWFDLQVEQKEEESK